MPHELLLWHNSYLIAVGCELLCLRSELRALHPTGGYWAMGNDAFQMHYYIWSQIKQMHVFPSCWLSMCVGVYAVGVLGLLIQLRIWIILKCYCMMLLPLQFICSSSWVRERMLWMHKTFIFLSSLPSSSISLGVKQLQSFNQRLFWPKSFFKKQRNLCD